LTASSSSESIIRNLVGDFSLSVAASCEIVDSDARESVRRRFVGEGNGKGDNNVAGWEEGGIATCGVEGISRRELAGVEGG
jgi:hypothetical protein